MNLKNGIAYFSILLIAGLMIYAYTVFRKAFQPNTNFESPTAYVLIPSGATLEQSKDSIKKYVLDWKQFDVVFSQFEMDKNLIPGRFELKRGMTNFKIAQALRKNTPVKLTFNNQETVEALAKRIASQLEPSEEEIVKVFSEMVFLKENNATKEQALSLYMPNTYEFYWNVSALKIRNTLHKEYLRFWNDERREKAEAIGLTPIEVSNLASIVQKETAKVDERPKVAGAYLNRVKRNMLLQGDSTVVYDKKLQLNDFDTIFNG